MSRRIDVIESVQTPQIGRDRDYLRAVASSEDLQNKLNYLDTFLGSINSQSVIVQATLSKPKRKAKPSELHPVSFPPCVNTNLAEFL
jgi:hypothetical protein